MGEKSYLKGYAKALDPDVKTKHKSKSWLRGFIDAHEQQHCGASRGCGKGRSIFGDGCGKNRGRDHNRDDRYFDNNRCDGMFNNNNFISRTYERLISYLMNLLGNQQNSIINNNYYNQENIYNTLNQVNNIYDIDNNTQSIFNNIV